ncbi:unnamed protein product [Lactuca virosa]|uniref:AP2/ERF domain-containing protein n=1 Tax=Lactuca virosa TaxID=75947 RepID=A0AAU9NDU1_9ASTR|nr:unnamed protein product [Lactuca virosa]
MYPRKKSHVWLRTFDIVEKAADAYDFVVREFRDNKAKTNFHTPTKLSLPTVTIGGKKVVTKIPSGGAISLSQLTTSFRSPPLHFHLRLLILACFTNMSISQWLIHCSFTIHKLSNDDGGGDGNILTSTTCTIHIACCIVT